MNLLKFPCIIQPTHKPNLFIDNRWLITLKDIISIESCTLKLKLDVSKQQQLVSYTRTYTENQKILKFNHVSDISVNIE